MYLWCCSLKEEDCIVHYDLVLKGEVSEYYLARSCIVGETSGTVEIPYWAKLYTREPFLRYLCNHPTDSLFQWCIWTAWSLACSCGVGEQNLLSRSEVIDRSFWTFFCQKKVVSAALRPRPLTRARVKWSTTVKVSVWAASLSFVVSLFLASAVCS